MGPLKLDHACNIGSNVVKRFVGLGANLVCLLFQLVLKDKGSPPPPTKEKKKHDFMSLFFPGMLRVQIPQTVGDIFPGPFHRVEFSFSPRKLLLDAFGKVTAMLSSVMGPTEDSRLVRFGLGLGHLKRVQLRMKGGKEN